jgi:hypothetical protein
MNLTPRQQAEALDAERTPQERFNSLHDDMAYIDTLDIEQAPMLVIRADPDSGNDEGVELTIVSTEFLADFKALVLARLQKSSREAAAAIRQAGIPEGCTASEMEILGTGITVTIVRRNDAPPLAHSEAEVVLD